MDSFLEQLFEESKPPLCRFFHPQQALELKFAAFSHCHSGWKTPPCSFQCQHVEICSLGLSLLQSWVLPKPLSHLPVISSVSPWGPCLSWAGSMSTQGISISIYLCRCTVPSSETCQPHESRVTTSLPWHYWTALHWLWSHKWESFPAIWGLGLFFSILSFFHLAEEELLQKWLTRTQCWDEALGDNTRLGTGVIFLTPSLCCFGLMSIPHSICSGLSRELVSLLALLVPTNEGRNWSHQWPLHYCLCRAGMSPRSQLQKHAGVVPKDLISWCCLYTGSGEGAWRTAQPLMPSPSC